MVRRILCDIPEVDYDEQAAAVIRKDMLAQAPSVLVPLLTNPEWIGYLVTGHCYTEVGRSFSSHSWGTAVPVYVGYEQSETAKGFLEPIIAAAGAQKAAKQELKKNLEVALNGCTTTNMVLKRFPEFEKYLPEEATKPSQNLPATTELMDSLKKLGWPK